MTSDQAGEIKVSRAIEGPDDLAALARRYMRHVGLFVFHVREFQHQGGVFFKFLLGADDHFVQHLAFVFEYKLYRLALFDFDFIWQKTHLVGHGDVNRALGGFGIASDAPGLLFFFDGGWFFLGVIVPVRGGLPDESRKHSDDEYIEVAIHVSSPDVKLM